MIVMWRRISEYKRGRPRGPLRSLADKTDFAYLIWISKNHEVDLRNLFKSLVHAWKNGRSSCGKISIECRCKTEGQAVFLITKGEVIVAQLGLSDGMLRSLPNVDLPPELIRLVQVKKKEISKGVERRIKDLSFGARDFSLEAKVVEKPIARLVFSRFAQPILVSNITISDGTGSIKLPLWNRQIDMVSVGDIVRIENGRVETFNGELLLKYGRLSVVNRLGDKKI